MKNVDVLAVFARAEGQARMVAGLAGDPRARQLLEDLASARAAVAELIEADEAFDLAYVDWAAEETDPLPLRDAFVAAKDRRRAALARAKGGAA